MDEFGGLLLNGRDHMRMAVAGRRDGDSGGEVEKFVSINVGDHDAASLLGNERIRASVRRRNIFAIAGENALLIGKPGTGKSHVAKAVANQAVLQGYKVQYLETDDFFTRFELSEPPQQEKRLRSILECDLLVLDETSMVAVKPPTAVPPGAVTV